jgi:hypothetical protein
VILGQVFTENLKCLIIKKRIIKMKKYNEEYFSVLDKKTGKKVLDCGAEEDALQMVAMDPQNRTYTKNKFLMGQVVDIEMPKALPTNEIVVNMDGGVGGSWEVKQPEKLPQIKLPEGQGEPVRI